MEKFTVVKMLHQHRVNWKFYLPMNDQAVDHEWDMLLCSFLAKPVNQDKYNGCLIVVQTRAQEYSDEVV